MTQFSQIYQYISSNTSVFIVRSWSFEADKQWTHTPSITTHPPQTRWRCSDFLIWFLNWDFIKCSTQYGQIHFYPWLDSPSHMIPMTPEEWRTAHGSFNSCEAPPHLLEELLMKVYRTAPHAWRITLTPNSVTLAYRCLSWLTSSQGGEGGPSY